MSSNYLKFITYEKAFILLSIMVNAFFVLYALGFLKNKIVWVETISFYLKIFIGVFLVAKFNPFYSLTSSGATFTKFDKRVVFSAGMYTLIINLIVFYNNYKENALINETKITKRIENQLLYPVPIQNKETETETEKEKEKEDKPKDCGCGCGGAKAGMVV
jgi:hypothetical protein